MAKKGTKVDKLPTDSYKGVRDFYPEEQAFQNYLAATWRGVCERWGYVEYGASILEPSELYKSKGVENEEIVNEQTYTFIDRGGREVTLRPEMTPTVGRLVAAKKRELGYPLRWYSVANFFRYERPQHGRLREFWQLNIDIFGSKSLAADAEIIALAHATMLAIGGTESDFIVKIGSRRFLDEIIARLNMDAPQAKQLRGLLDRRAKMPEDEFNRALTDLGLSTADISADNPPEDIVEVLKVLGALGVSNAVFDPSIVRGFDYYTGVVFEIFDTHPENNRSVFGGGRYDNLLSLFSDESLPAVGAAAGDATIRNFMQVRGLLPEYAASTKVYVAVAKKELVESAIELAKTLRKENVSVALDFGEKKLGEQIKTASKHKIPYLIVVGEDEVASGTYKVKDLATGEEKPLSHEQLSNFFLNL